jgi:hypothetical protein
MIRACRPQLSISITTAAASCSRSNGMSRRMKPSPAASAPPVPPQIFACTAFPPRFQGSFGRYGRALELKKAGNTRASSVASML